ncbi:hypothetical protein SLS62_011067 [Diatrype stigma]|uniref:Uncharacterized protein n=1 Tax=Diatrype stigma TaxID=117547 RepID=A0AAN9U5Z3_9PEZI
MATAQNLGQPRRWWSAIRTPITEKFNSEEYSYRYYQAYGWAQARLGASTVIDSSRVSDIAAFYDGEITDDAWRWYKINYMMHRPFASVPTWETVANRLGEILDDPLLLVQYIGVRPHGAVDKTGWCKVGHACHFILRLLWARLEHEDKLASQGKSSAWASVDRWAAAHVLYTLLSGLQDDEARHFRDTNHAHYVREYRAAEANGGVNPAIVPPNSLTPEQYQKQLLDDDSSFLGRLAAYFRAMP